MSNISNMSEFEMDFGQQLIELIAMKIGDNGLKAFIKDFAEWADCVLEDDEDEDYVEVNESESSSDSDVDDGELTSVEVEEEYQTEVDENGFHSLKDCEVKSQK